MSEKKNTKPAKNAKSAKATPATRGIEMEKRKDAPMSDAALEKPLATLSADEAQSEMRAETPKRSRRKKDSAPASETETRAELPTPTPGVLGADAQAEREEVRSEPARGEKVPNEPVPTAPVPHEPVHDEPVPHEPLKLARGAFIAMRKSGGLKFSTREVVVYPDGRVAYDARGVPQKEYNRLRRALNDGQIIGLRKLLDQTNFWHAQSEGKQNPDAFAYEIAARLGQRSNEIEVFDGSVPENLKPLVERLVKLLPEAE